MPHDSPPPPHSNCGETGPQADDFLPEVYTELRRMAAQRLAHEKPGQTLQATALVHEAWLRLAKSRDQVWRSRTHFFAAAAESIRRILIDQARRKATLKRGNGAAVEALNESQIELKSPPAEIIAVHEALDELAKTEPETAQVVKWKYFVGMSFKEIADVMNVSLSTVERHWAYAKVWLRAAIRESQHTSPQPVKNL